MTEANALPGAAGLRASAVADIPVSARAAYVLAFLIGYAYALSVFGVGVATGYQSFWGVADAGLGGRTDTAFNLSGYYWIAQDAWRWPLLALPLARFPTGVNGYLFDPISILALIAKVVHSLSGYTINLYPYWMTASFALDAVALAALVRALGQRTLVATVLAACIGAMAPVVHYRWGHPPLVAQWLPIFALALYASIKAHRPSRIAPFLALIGLTAGAVTISLYLFVMTGAVAGAAIVQAAFDRKLTIAATVGFVALLPATGIVILWMFGALETGEITHSYAPFGKYSANLLSLFWPQTSGLFQWTGIWLLTRGIVGGASGQYEGFAYLGFGVLVLVAIALARSWRTLPQLIRDNPVLSAALLVLTLWAVSNRIYLGGTLLATFPVPGFLDQTVLSWFRSSGRFLWPLAWLIMALGICGSLSALRARAAMALGLFVLALQWQDLAVFRGSIAAALADPGPSIFGPPSEVERVRADLRTYRRVAVIPTHFCSLASPHNNVGIPPSQMELTNIQAQLQLLAAQSNAAMRQPDTGRLVNDCLSEHLKPLAELAGGGILVLVNQPQDWPRKAEARAGFECRDYAFGLFCLPPRIRREAVALTPERSLRS
jgi:hypothetical protein